LASARVPCSNVVATFGARKWCGRRDSNPHIFRYWNLNPARLPIPPRPRGRLKRAAYNRSGPFGNPHHARKLARFACVPEERSATNATTSTDPRRALAVAGNARAEPARAADPCARRGTRRYTEHRRAFPSVSRDEPVANAHLAGRLALSRLNGRLFRQAASAASCRWRNEASAECSPASGSRTAPRQPRRGNARRPIRAAREARSRSRASA
jgi:hypothetical protein